MSKFYVTTAIPYVNATPHIGNIMDCIYADVLARYHRQSGDQVLFSTGVDEHGSKVAEKAKEAGKTPQVYADEVTEEFIKIIKSLNISNDRFVRTSNKAHADRVQLIWKNLENYIYKGKYVGLYCSGCEEFVTETTAKTNNMTCPLHNRAYERLEEENYFFALSKFTDNIKKVIDSGEFIILPETKKHEILSLLKGGLEDISISRPSDKLVWGIPVSGDEKQVMYVWFDALLNYITLLGYPENKDFKIYWPADVQVIGKEIVRFHAAFWPAILMALNLPLSKLLYVHGHIGVDGQKMSKTLGNVINPQDIIEKYGADAYRYYFLRHVSSYKDGDFSWDLMSKTYNNELANELGNAVQRVASMIGKYQENVIGGIPPATHDIHEYQDAFTVCRFDKALNEAWEQVRGINQYIDTEKPWEIAKIGDEVHLKEVLAYATSCLLEIAELIYPFMPDTARKIKDVFSEGVVKPLKQPLFPKDES